MNPVASSIVSGWSHWSHIITRCIYAQVISERAHLKGRALPDYRRLLKIICNENLKIKSYADEIIDSYCEQIQLDIYIKGGHLMFGPIL